ncbi:MAG: hypothetical protein AAFX76_11935, partial [Planctomycetota bacterium]
EKLRYANQLTSTGRSFDYLAIASIVFDQAAGQCKHGENNRGMKILVNLRLGMGVVQYGNWSLPCSMNMRNHCIRLLIPIPSGASIKIMYYT